MDEICDVKIVRPKKNETMCDVLGKRTVADALVDVGGVTVHFTLANLLGRVVPVELIDAA